MKMSRLLLVVLTAAQIAPAVALDRVPDAHQNRDSGDVRLADDLKIGRYQGGKYISQPDALEIQGSGITCVPGAICDASPLTASGRTLASVAARIGDAVQLADTCAPMADCTAAFATAAATAAAQKKALVLPPYAFTLSGKVALSGHQHIYGYGVGVSIIRLMGSANIEYRGGPFGVEGTHALHIHDFTVRNTATANDASALLDIAWESRDKSPVASGTQRTLTMHDIDVVADQSSPTVPASFKVGVRIFNATTAYVYNNRIRHNYANFANTPNTIGWLVGTDLQAVDMYFRKNLTYFGEIGWKFVGTGSGFGFEGLEFRDNLTIINDIGLIVDSVAVHDLVKLIGNNFNNLKRNVFIRNMHNVHIIANLFYAYPDYKNRDWKAVELYNDDPNLSEFGASNIIQGNSFHTFSVPTQNKIGITISATSNASTSTIIDANQFTSLTQVGLLGPGSNNIKFTDTNVITATPIGLKDLGASNIVARYVAAATGYRRANDGAVTAWGTASLIVDGSGNVTVPLSGNVARAFRETPYVALAQNSFPSASASRVISWNQAASTASQLVFHVDGAAPNDNFQISWRAEGH